MININTKQAFSAIKSLWNHLGEREKKKSLLAKMKWVLPSLLTYSNIWITHTTRHCSPFPLRTWVLEDGSAVTGSVLGKMVDVKSLVEDGHHDCEETGEAGVEDQIENADLHCKKRTKTESVFRKFGGFCFVNKISYSSRLQNVLATFNIILHARSLCY